jgi:DNA-binding beta-propeller fold protein YncE
MALALGGLVLLVVAGRLISHGLTSNPPKPPAPPATTPNSVSLTAPASTLPPGVTATIDNLGVGARQLAVGSGGVWVALWDDGQVVRVDPTRNRVAARIPVGRPQQGPLGIAAGFGAVWVTDYGDGALLRIDPARDRVAAWIPIGEVGSVATGAGAVWVTGGEAGHRVIRVDPRTNQVTAKIPIPGGFQLWNVAADRRWVWLENVDGTMWRIDATSNHATRLRVTVRWASTSMGPGTLVAGDGMVWAGSDQELVRLDPATGRPLVRLPWKGQAGQGFTRAGGGVGTIGAGGVWFAWQQGVSGIDPASNGIIGTVRFLGGIRSLASAGGVLWALSGDSVVRIEPARIAGPPP